MIANATILMERHSHLDAALKKLKNLLDKNGTFHEMHRRSYYEKPSERRRRKSAMARKKAAQQEKKRHLANRDAASEDRKPHHFNGDYVPSPNYRKGNR
jgi:small subunit ribosomal protein S21